MIFSQKSKPASGSVREVEEEIEEGDEENDDHNPGGFSLSSRLLGLGMRKRLGGRVGAFLPAATTPAEEEEDEDEHRG